jgi:proteasome lid subunit RPN8/RPN11
LGDRQGLGAFGRLATLLPEPALAEIFRQSEAGYPEEICGMVVGKPSNPATFRVRQVSNIANQEPQRDTAGQARDARTAYKMDPLEQVRVLREADRQGWEVLVFYHSHPDHDAYFSAMDRDRSLTPEGDPIWPGATYLVVSVVAGRALSACCFTWDAACRDFLECPLVPPRRSRVISIGIGPARRALGFRRLMRYKADQVSSAG